MECPICKHTTILVENSKFMSMSKRFWICYLECYICNNVISKKSVPVDSYEAWYKELMEQKFY